MLDILKSVVYGVVEGITEWLPISSTGHLILLKEWLPMGIREEVWDLFLVVVQLGAILASIILFWNKIWPFQKPDSSNGTSIFKKESWQLWFKVAIASIPGVAFKLLKLDELCDKYFYNATGISIALIVFGILFLVIENLNKDKTPKFNDTTDITYGLAVCIGLFQIVAAAFPGTSRSGVTIIGALILGVSRIAASEFTFILAIPAMLGASLMELKDFYDTGLRLENNELLILSIGVIVAFIISVLAIKFLMSYIRKHDFKPFGVYRIVLGIAVILYFAITE